MARTERFQISTLSPGSTTITTEVANQINANPGGYYIELRNAEEKAVALQPRLTSRSAPATQQENDENALTREQELGVEVADLRRDLELKDAELQGVRDEIEQYKSIAQTAEEELQQMNDASGAKAGLNCFERMDVGVTSTQLETKCA